jgi:lysophospholipase L1-like esterase
MKGVFRLSIAFCAGVCLMQPGLARAQDSLSSTYINFGLVVDSLNVIGNVGHLDTFFENLYQQKKNNDRKISIIHLGDSHIQADFLTSVIRKRFQRTFGNAGRGLVVPYRVAGTNEPLNFLTSSTVTWTSKRCVFPDQPLPIGVGGITIQTSDPESRLYLYMNDPQSDYAFNKVTFFVGRDSTAFRLRLKNTSYSEIGIKREDSLATEFRLSERVDGLVVDVIKESGQQQQLTLFGMSVENGSKGILYHSIGVNGAKFVHYVRAEYFSQQTSRLAPALFVIALGTNESLDNPYIDKNFETHIESLVSQLIEKNPLSKFLFITPQQNLQKEIVNPGVKTIRDKILKFAVENGYAIWDLYTLAGEAASPAVWKKKNLLRADGVHLTIDGYVYQANVLYHALMKGYQDYVSNRHP